MPDQLQLLHRGLSEPVVTPGAFDRPDPDGSLSRGDNVRIPRAAVQRPMNATAAILTSLSLAVASGCGVRAIPLDSDASFAMHQENRTFVVDRPRSGTPAVVTAAEWIRLPGAPVWALSRNGQTLAGFWDDGNAGTTVRAGLQASDRPLGSVRPSWDDNAIRLHLEPPGGQPVKLGVFRRTESGGGTSVLTRDAQTILDVRGRYQATLLDATGAQVGWMRLRIGPYEPAPRIYEAKLPAGVSDELAVAAVLSLASEIDWIEANTQNVYQKDRGPLIQSIPIP